VDVESEHRKGTSQSRRVEKGIGLDREHIIMIGVHYRQAEQKVDAGSKRAKIISHELPNHALSLRGCMLMLAALDSAQRPLKIGDGEKDAAGWACLAAMLR
jgi:hypothetical protein